VIIRATVLWSLGEIAIRLVFPLLTSFSGNGGAKFSEKVKVFSKPAISAMGTDMDS
jgi:hypothetical protein